MTSTCTLDDIALPPDIEWDDEGSWLPVASVVAMTIKGALVVQASAVQAGRPITLIARGDQHVWLPYETVEALRAAASTNLDTPMVLTLIDGRTFNVLWRHQDIAVEYDPVEYVVSDDPTINAKRPYTLTLRLMQV